MPRVLMGSMAVSRVSISFAALLVKVTAMRPMGETWPVWISQAMRVVSTRVLPEPAPASTRAEPGAVTAAMEQVVVAERRALFFPQRGQIDIIESLPEPEDRRNVALRFGGQGIGETVQVNAVLTERFAMIAQVEHRRLEAVVISLQGLDQLGQEVVGIENGIIVSVADLILAALTQVIALAGWLELLEVRRIAFVICRAMVAHLMQDDDDIAGRVAVDKFLETGQHADIAAFGVASRVIRRHAEILGRHTRRYAFGIGIVVEPEHMGAGALRDIDDILLVQGPLSFVVFASERREHAGHRDAGRGAARPEIAETDDLLPAQQGIGLAGIAVQRKAVGARRFTDDDDDQLPVRIACRDVRIHGDGDKTGGGRGRQATAQVTDGRIDVIHRVGIGTQRLVLTEKGIIEGAEAGDDQRQGNENAGQQFQTGAQFKAPAAPAHGYRQKQRRRQHPEQREIGNRLDIDQVGGLGRVGLRHVVQHFLVDDDAEVIHEVGRQRRQDQNQRQERLGQTAKGEQRQQQRHHGADKHRQRGHLQGVVE
jgi:hypothetical protein